MYPAAFHQCSSRQEHHVIMSSTSRVLIVDDYQPWRSHLRSFLEATGRWQIVGEAGDGVEGLEQSKALRPDLILLDVSLPKMDGLTMARALMADGRVPSRILFLSQHHSVDIVEAALDTGALGYLTKSEAVTHLEPAMEAVVAGGAFLGSSVRHTVIHPRTNHNRHRSRRHEVLFPEEATSLLDGYVTCLRQAIGRGDACVVIAPAARQTQIAERLEGFGIDISRLQAKGRYRFIDAADALS